MKKNCIGSMLVWGVIGSLLLIACSEKPERKKGHGTLQVDSTLAALASPANARVAGNIPLIRARRGMQIFSIPLQGIVTYDDRQRTKLASKVAGRIEKLRVKYNFQRVSKGELIMEIYSPELVAAQRELLMLAADPDNQALAGAARQRLQLLGMTGKQIEDVLSSGEVLYRIGVYSPVSGYILEEGVTAHAAGPAMATVSAAGSGMENMGGDPASAPTATVPDASPSSTLIRAGQYVGAGQPLFSIYDGAALVAEFALPAVVARKMKVGQKLLFSAGSGSGHVQPARIGLIEPVVREGERFAVARVYTRTAGLFPGQILNGNVPIVFNDGFWVDRRAVWQTGGKSVVFRREKGMLVPTPVEVGLVSGDWAEIRTDIRHLEIASNASYLIDSDSFIKGQDLAEK